MSQSSYAYVNSFGNSIDNFEFYSCTKGREILDSNNFPPDIIEFLDKEYKTAKKIIDHCADVYHALLEVGCGNARNIHLASLLDLKYFGIDFIESEVDAAQKKIKEKKLAGHVKCLSILELNQKTTPIPSTFKTICLLPFNVFGNIFEPVRVFEVMSDLNYAMLISTYRSEASQSLLLYYKACGLNDIEAITLTHGMLFHTKEGFRSMIYNDDYFYSLAQQFKFSIESVEFSTLGKMYYLRSK